MPGNYINNYGELFLNYLPYQSLPYKILKLTEGDLMINRYEWQEEINIIVNPQDDYYLPFFTQKWNRNMVEKLFPPRSVYHELKATCDAISHIIKIKLLESLHKNRKLQTLEEHLQSNNTLPQRNSRSTHENNKIQ